jgi:flagellar biosynthesis protein FlhF
MQTHTFVANTANEAVAQIRAELGPSAVVLSVRKLPRSGLSRLVRGEQIEVVATVERPAAPDPQGLQLPEPAVGHLQNEIRALKQQFAAMRLAQSASSPLPQRELGGPSDPYRILVETGILPSLAEQLLQDCSLAQNSAREDLVIEQLKEILRSRWQGESNPSERAARLFVGVPGSGKSTALCKLLAQTCLVEGQSATVYQLDSHVANPSGQAGIFAEIVGAQYERTLPKNLEGNEQNVFIDVPGVGLGDQKGLAGLASIIESFGLAEIHLVLNAAYESTHLLNQVNFFADLGITSLILTHLDEETRWGKVWNLVLGTNYIVRYLSCGQNIPGNLFIGSADLVLERQFCGK